MRRWFVASDVVAASSLLAAVVVTPAGEASRAAALLSIVAGVLPGLLLTGTVKRLVAGAHADAASVQRKAVQAAALNLPLVALAGALLDLRQPWPAAAAFVVIAAMGCTAQACTAIWYYASLPGRALARGKAISAGVRVACAAAAIVRHELAWAVLSLPLSALAEFLSNRQATTAGAGTTAAAPSERPALSPLGIAYAASRAVQAGIKLGLEPLLGPLIASFLLIEQLLGGVNSLFEKYFARTTRARGAVRLAKCAYLVLMLASLPTLARVASQPGSAWALPALAVVALAALLPLSEMFTALQRRDEQFVAIGSVALAALCGTVLLVAWALRTAVGPIALALYVALPALTFFFYWMAALDARDHPQR